ARIFACVPPELPVPGADAMVVVHLTVVNLAEQSAINHRFDGQELAGKPALETDAGFHARFRDGFFDRQTVLPAQRERFFDDQMLSGLGGCDRVPRMLVRITTD